MPRTAFVPIALLGEDAYPQLAKLVAAGEVFEDVELLVPDGVAGYRVVELQEAEGAEIVEPNEIFGDQIFIGSQEAYNALMVEMAQAGYDVTYGDITLSGENIVVIYSAEISEETLVTGVTDTDDDLEDRDLPVGCTCGGDTKDLCVICVAAWAGTDEQQTEADIAALDTQVKDASALLQPPDAATEAPAAVSETEDIILVCVCNDAGTCAVCKAAIAAEEAVEEAPAEEAAAKAEE